MSQYQGSLNHLVIPGEVANPTVKDGIVYVPLKGGATLSFIAGSATKISKACQAPCRSKKIKVEFRLPPESCTGCGVGFGFSILKVVPPDRRQDIYALNTYQSAVYYTATTFLEQNPGATIDDVLNDAVAFFAEQFDQQDVHEYVISKVDSTHLLFEVHSDYCFDFLVTELKEFPRCIVGKPEVVETFADSMMTKEFFQQLNAPLIFSQIPGEPLPDAYLVCNNACYYNIKGCQPICDDNSLYSGHGNAQVTGYVSGNINLDYLLLVEDNGAALAQWETALATATGKAITIETPCNIAQTEVDAAFAVTGAGNEATAAFTAAGSLTNLIEFGKDVEVTLKSSGTSLPFRKKNATLTNGVYEHAPNGTPAAIPAGTYVLKATVTVLLTGGRKCNQRIIEEFTV